MTNYLTIKEEVELRNKYVLSNAGTPIKAYYLWNEESLLYLSGKERIKWWESLEEYQEKKEPLFKWINEIITRLQTQFINTEYCSKRRPYIMNCDI